MGHFLNVVPGPFSSVSYSHVKERLSEEHAGYIRQLCGMANNLNQLAHKANAGGFLEARWDCKVAVARIHELISKIGI